MKRKNEIDFRFIDSILKTYCVVLLVFFPFGTYYLGIFATLAIWSAGIWSMLNLTLIRALVKSTLHPNGPDTGRAIAFAFLKFPILYFSGYLLLRIAQFEALYLLIGFSGLLATIILKLLSGLFVLPENTASQTEKPQGMPTT